jgi:clan AA aspartic protease (TIGR02281 family)
MNAKFLFGLMIGALLLVFVMRSGVPDEIMVAKAVSSPQNPPIITSTPKSVFTDADTRPPNLGELVLERQSDGHFYTTAHLGSADVRFLVDTGASGIALTGTDAANMGLRWTADELQKVGRGVNGDVLGKIVMLDHVQVGDLVVDKVQAAIIPSGLDVSLLGQSFLSKVSTVNIAGDKMTLH